MMNLAVGRLHLAMYFAPRAPVPAATSNNESESNLERSHRRDQALRQVESDRRHWESNSLPTGGRL
jgi:hypothetical protein